MTDPNHSSQPTETEARAEAARRGRVETAVNGVVSSLSAMQRTFLVEYLLTGNATRAAEAAGYTHPDKQGPRLRHNDKIQAAIDEYFHRQEMSAGEVIARLSQQAKAEYADYINADGSVDLARLKNDGLMHLVRGTKPTQYGLVVEFYDAHTALVDVARYHGLFGPKGDGDDPLHTVGMTLDEWRTEQARRRREAEAQTAETLDIFEDE